MWCPRTRFTTLEERRKVRSMKQSQSSPDWLPDWTCQEEYPDQNYTSSRQWAWEFLRRNPHYRNDYYLLTKVSNEGLFPFSFSLKRELTIEDLPECEMKEWLVDQNRDKRRKQKFPEDYIKLKYGVETILPPSYESVEEFHHPYIPKPLNDIVDPLFERQPKGQQVILSFNISLPIVPQIEEVKILLEKEQKKRDLSLLRKHYRPQDYIKFLRILDAAASGVTNYEIGSVIFPDYKSGEYSDPDSLLRHVRKSRRTAERFRDKDYRWLATVDMAKKSVRGYFQLTNPFKKEGTKEKK